MDIQVYFDRIGYTGTADTTLKSLEELIRCHLQAVPFENLDCCYTGAPLSNDLPGLYEKIVLRRRGGICFELNGLFCALLQAMGYQCYSVEVRIHAGPEHPARVCHQGIVVRIGNRRYYCDVGFGGPGPKGLLPLDADPVQLVNREYFQVEADGLHTHIRCREDVHWVDMLTFADIPCIPEDFTAHLYYMAMEPGSYFVRQRLVNLCLPDGGSLALTDNRFTVRQGGQVLRQELADEGAVTQILQKEFGLYL